MEKIRALMSSRRWGVAIAAGLVAAGGHRGVSLNPETVQWVGLLAGSWIVGDSRREAKESTVLLDKGGQEGYGWYRAY